MVVIRARVHRMTTKKMYRYTKDTLLAFATLPSCQTRPDGIDPVLWRYDVMTMHFKFLCGSEQFERQSNRAVVAYSLFCVIFAPLLV